MSENTKIEWCDHTFNPWEGCQKVGPGCDHCYAETRNARFGGGTAVNWGPGAPRRRTSAANWSLPLRWNAQAEAFMAQHGRRQRVFCASLADVFDNAVDPQWRADLFALIAKTPNLDWLLLTKRIGNATGMCLQSMFIIQDRQFDPEAKNYERVAKWPWPNVWIGSTITSQVEADRDIPKLLAVPARVRFLSVEPMLAPIDIRWALPDTRTACCHRCGFRTNSIGVICPNDSETLRSDVGVDWVICGGESGPSARPMHPDWARSLRDQCQAAGVPFLFKQWGEWRPISQMTDSEDRALWRSRVLAKPHEDQGNLDDIHGRVCTVDSTVLHLDGSVHHFLEPNAFPHGAMTMYRVGKKAAGRLLDGHTWDEVPA